MMHTCYLMTAHVANYFQKEDAVGIKLTLLYFVKKLVCTCHRMTRCDLMGMRALNYGMVGREPFNC